MSISDYYSKRGVSRSQIRKRKLKLLAQGQRLRDETAISTEANLGSVDKPIDQVDADESPRSMSERVRAVQRGRQDYFDRLSRKSSV